VGNEGDGRLIAHRSCILRPIASASIASEKWRGYLLNKADDEEDRYSAAIMPLPCFGNHFDPVLDLVLNAAEDETKRPRDRRVTRRSRGLLWSSPSLEVVRLSLPALQQLTMFQSRALI
jgi:hypothetical protein